MAKIVAIREVENMKLREDASDWDVYAGYEIEIKSEYNIGYDDTISILIDDYQS